MARPQINIRVEQERKDRWKEAATESPEYDGLTHLIRLAVEKELAEDTDASDAPQTSADAASSDMLREVKGNTERIEDGVTDVKTRLRQVEERVGGQSEFSLRAAVRETLRAAEDGLTAGQIAARLNAKAADVMEALEGMEGDTTYPAEDDPDTGDTRWNLFGGV
ncbi:hypothetical protein [Haloarcula laminariae]|uniref:hypothetical protein n=1 Tax=Haloarcula laminariae TaxID=2961577 RepID=UPI002405BF1C|nr:hypothetical protein [Halomicroarcula sp. FL173]